MAEKHTDQFKNRDRLIEIGLAIASFRKMRGMTQQQLADEARMSRSHLSSIEAPKVVRPFSLEILFNIADALGIDASDLLCFPDKHQKPEGRT